MSELEVLPGQEPFDEQLRSLAVEAQHDMEERALRKTLPSLVKAMRPLVLGIEALSRATEENTNVLYKLQKAAAAQTGLSSLMSNVQEKIDQKQLINQQLFDALHRELRDYKDAFLLDVLQKPIIRDLIELNDDLSELDRQVSRFIESGTGGGEVKPNATTIRANLRHTQEALLEILDRMEVVRQVPSPGKLDRTKQRAVGLTSAESLAEDLEIVASVKPGFKWRDRVIRPEEVIIKKWREGYLMVMPKEQKAGASPTDPE